MILLPQSPHILDLQAGTDLCPFSALLHSGASFLLLELLSTWLPPAFVVTASSPGHTLPRYCRVFFPHQHRSLLKHQLLGDAVSDQSNKITRRRYTPYILFSPKHLSPSSILCTLLICLFILLECQLQENGNVCLCNTAVSLRSRIVPGIQEILVGYMNSW